MASNKHHKTPLQREMDAQMAGIDAAIRAREDELMPYMPVHGRAYDGLSRKLPPPTPSESQRPAIVLSIKRSLRKTKRRGLVFDPEIPMEVIEQLISLKASQLDRILKEAAGHAARLGRDYITVDDLQFAKRASQDDERKTTFVFMH